MCDCYEAKCEGCDRTVAMHIANWSAPREHVHVWCPTCAAGDKGVHVVFAKNKRIAGRIIIFVDLVTRASQIFNHKHRVVGKSQIGEPVVIVCTNPGGYGVHLN